MRVLVTGADGFVGRAIDRALRAAGMVTIPVSRRSKSGPEPTTAHRVVCDLVMANEVRSLPPADIIIHAAALMKGAPSQMWQANVEATRLLCEYAVNCGAKRFLFFSSGGVYGYKSNHPQLESDAWNPIGYYGYTKAHGELICRATRDLSALETTSLRLYFPYGPNQHSGLIHNLKQSVKAQSTITMSQTGGPVVSLTHISDLTRAVLELTTSRSLQPEYNLCSDEALSISSITKILEKALDARANIVRTENPTGDLIGANSRLKQDTDWTPQKTLAGTIEELIHEPPIQHH